MNEMCTDCAHMKRDKELRHRCYSPQLVAMKTPGIIIHFERDEHPEPDRSHSNGTGKCGRFAINFVKREAF